MLTILPALIVFVVVFSISIFFWFWWAGPRDQVPPHLDADDLRRLEVQDRLRQTNYQILTAIGLGAIFLTTIFEFFAVSRQWNSDFEFKVNQERIEQFVGALRNMESENPSTEIGGIRTIATLGTEAPENYNAQANEILSSHIKKRLKNMTVLKETGECYDTFGETAEQVRLHPKPNEEDREEAPADVQAAMRALGNPKFSALRVRYENGGCAFGASDKALLRLEHLNLDDLDLSGLDFSCGLMSQSRFHRVSFSGSKLQGVDFRGTQFGDFEIPASPASTGGIGRFLYLPENLEAFEKAREADERRLGLEKYLKNFRIWIGTETAEEIPVEGGGPPKWKRYRCWVTDFRFADLENGNFEGATLAGADFSHANLTGVNLCRADISRANFADAKGIDRSMISDACVGKSGKEAPDLDAQPFGLKKKFGQGFIVPRCDPTKVCSDGVP